MTETEQEPLTGSELDALDAWWRAANYLSVGQIYLLDNPLLTEPLRPEHVKPRLLGHWGTTPGLNLIYAHLNRVIRNQDLNVIYIAGPGHGGPGMVANTYLEGTYSELYPRITQDTAGMGRLFRQFSFPGGIPSHVAPETPGLDPRGRRAGLLAGARLRRGVRQPGPDRGLRDRRRRGRDRAAGRQLALEQVPRPGPGRRGAADPAPERLQDRQPDGAGPDTRTTSSSRCCAATGTRCTRSRAMIPKLVHQQLAATLDAVIEEIRAIQRAGPGGGRSDPAGLAGHRPAHAQGLDRAQGRGRAAGGGDVAGAPGPDRRGPDQPGAPGPARGVDALLPGGGAVRRLRGAGARAGRAGPARRPADEREPARQRRPAAARPRGCPTSGTTPCAVSAPGAGDGRGDPGARRPGCAT